jgi:hypothetical protein
MQLQHDKSVVVLWFLPSTSVGSANRSHNQPHPVAASQPAGRAVRLFLSTLPSMFPSHRSCVTYNTSLGIGAITALGLLTAAHVTDATPEPRRLLLAG